MTVTFSITVKSPKDGDHFVHTHDVSGEGESLNECRRKALDELAKPFPAKGKHEFIAIKQL
jgi:hypothetical protein